MDVSLQSLSKTFDGGSVAVDEVSIQVKSGTFFFLLGPSGCGKTTVLRLISGFEEPTSGDILFDGSSVVSLSPQRRNIGMVFQNYALWPHMTVEKNIEYGLTVRKIPIGERKERLDAVLDVVQMSEYRHRFPGQLSGGQQQRVALARALVIKPALLLFDEPLSNLDAKLRLELRDEIRRIQNATGITTIYVTHDQKEALSMADQIGVMNRGRLMQVGSPLELYRHPANKFIASFIGETNFLEASVADLCSQKTVFSSPVGVFECRPNGQDLRVGQQVCLSIRPEALRVSARAVSGPNCFSAKVEKVTYLGEMEQVDLLGPQNAPLRSWFFNPVGTCSGKTLNVKIRAEDISVLVDDAKQLH